MAYNKDSYDEYRLTPKQEKFVELLLEGKSQYEAYITAYPKAKTWKRNTVDSRASVLVKNKKISKRLDDHRKVVEKQVEWTRKRALNEINYVLEMNRKDIERQNQGYEEELNLKQNELLEYAKLLTVENIDKTRLVKKIQNLTRDIAVLKQQRRVDKSNTAGILNAARVLNRMYGYDITKVEIDNRDEERENMEKLSVEELKAIAYANINGSDTDKG